MSSIKVVTSNDRPPRYTVEGFKHLIADREGFEKIEELRQRFVGRVENNASNRRELRVELLALLDKLKHQGHLFRKDGKPIT